MTLNYVLLSMLIEVLLLLQTFTKTQLVHYQQVDSTTCLIFIQCNASMKIKKIM